MLVRYLSWCFRSIIDKVTPKDVGALMSATGVNFEIDRFLRGDGDEEPVQVDQPYNLLTALRLEGNYPVVAWKRKLVSSSFLWKKETDLAVRDRIYLL